MHIRLKLWQQQRMVLTEYDLLGWGTQHQIFDCCCDMCVLNIGSNFISLWHISSCCILISGPKQYSKKLKDTYIREDIPCSWLERLNSHGYIAIILSYTDQWVSAIPIKMSFYILQIMIKYRWKFYWIWHPSKICNRLLTVWKQKQLNNLLLFFPILSPFENSICCDRYFHNPYSFLGKVFLEQGFLEFEKQRDVFYEFLCVCI